MTMFALPLVFVPTAGFWTLRSFLRAYPSATSEVDIQFLLRGLKLASISAAALPALFIVRYIAFSLPGCNSLLETLGNVIWFPFAVAGNGVNLFAIFDCLRERGGASLLTIFLLILLQLCWIFTLVTGLVWNF